MNTLRLYPSSSALLPLLLPLLLQLQLLTLCPSATSALPLRAGDSGCAQCSLLFRNLLLNVTDLLQSDNLCFGITSDKAVVKSQTETLLTCTPPLTQNSSCNLQRNVSFSERDCLRNIMKDLLYYEAAIKSYIHSPLRSPEEEVALLSPTLGVIESLKNCSLLKSEDIKYSEDVAQMWGSDTYTNRQEMCKMMRGFYVRAITINRAMGYISSGEHRK
ncbi:interleukin-12 subunit alpha [Cynoglossus semilaevis]|uniref:Interleukin-12 subunit alpha n=1 Tax=Cynoglossus semilaevis TaxID=244447 RepID=A0A3P8WMS7_CYNSE|nr:interleukin-12 subunit alpha-like [Cynoglossus semilaevis]